MNRASASRTGAYQYRHYHCDDRYQRYPAIIEAESQELSKLQLPPGTHLKHNWVALC